MRASAPDACTRSATCGARTADAMAKRWRRDGQAMVPAHGPCDESLPCSLPRRTLEILLRIRVGPAIRVRSANAAARAIRGGLTIRVEPAIRVVPAVAPVPMVFVALWASPSSWAIIRAAPACGAAAFRRAHCHDRAVPAHQERREPWVASPLHELSLFPAKMNGSLRVCRAGPHSAVSCRTQHASRPSPASKGKPDKRALM